MDPRIARFVEKFALAKGQKMLGLRGKDKLPSPEELAGWALERMSLDPLRALGLLRKMPMPARQRQAATRLLRPLVTSIPLTAASTSRGVTKYVPGTIAKSVR
jgi:hypothetical protein